MTRRDDKPPAHTLADHRAGVAADHAHDPHGDHDHDHDHDFPADGAVPDDARARDEVPLVSVGIDIGSAGTQVVFSRLTLRRQTADPAARYVAAGREVLFQSPVALTPYAGEERMDHAAIRDIVDRAYEAAGLHPDAVDTGAVILTGAALRRENAEAIAAELAEVGGEFVCACAGHHMEAMLAAYGSGSALASHERGCRILNIDIGGGTTKLALLDDGRIAVTAALAVGGRLLVVDDGGRILRLEPAGRDLAEQAGFRWAPGEAVAPGLLDRFCGWMADRLLDAVVDGRPAPGAALYLTAPPGALGTVDGVRFSGGVAEYVYGRESRDFGDLGRRLGAALRARVEAGRLPWPLMPAGECIRATALGAASCGVQLSGGALYASDPRALLPRRNLPVLRPEYSFAVDRIDTRALAAAIQRRFTAFDLGEGEAEAVLAFRWQGEQSRERLAALARGIAEGLPATIARALPVYVVLEGTGARGLGVALKEELGIASEVLVLDGVALWEFDYVDLGRIRMPSHTVPVTIKSLVFRDDPRLPHSHARHRGHPAIGARARS